MSQNENSSFIPRRTAAVSKRPRNQRSIGLFGYVSYIVFSASVLIGAGVFFYYQYIQVQLSEKQEELNIVKNQFDQTEMNRVQEFESFLSTVNRLYQSSITTEMVFNSIEGSVAEGSVFSSLTIERGPENLEVLAEVTADSFDTALFQRRVFNDFPLLSSFSLDSAVLANLGTNDSSSDGEIPNISQTSSQEGNESVLLTLVFDIPTSDLSFARIESTQRQFENDENNLSEDDINSFELGTSTEETVSTTTENQQDSAEGENVDPVNREEGEFGNNNENI